MRLADPRLVLRGGLLTLVFGLLPGCLAACDDDGSQAAGGKGDASPLASGQDAGADGAISSGPDAAELAQCPRSAAPDPCAGRCTDVGTDGRNCGSCGNVCASGARCVSGECACPEARPGACEGECVDTDTDLRHCGGCGEVCSGRCEGGECRKLVALALGGQHTVARLEGGALAVWGSGVFGQLGSGPAPSQEVPFVLEDPASVLDVSAGRGHTCVVLAAGTVSCFGDNTFIQLGGETPPMSASPLAITGLSGVTRVAAGGRHSCALSGDGTAWCWGWNTNGQLGDGTAEPFRAAPAPVVGLQKVTDLSAGASHGCAVAGGGEVWCWGDNSTGQIGEATRTFRRSPVRVQNLGPARAVSAGGDRTCALLEDATVSCWGGPAPAALPAGADAGVPDGAAAPAPSLGPAAVEGLTDVVALAVGKAHACAVLAGGTARCWGDEARGQLGDGQATPSTAPVVVAALTGAVAVAAGDAHTCALRKDGALWCWGDDTQHQLGRGLVPTDGKPGPVRFTSP